jgi:hypothetical protein
MLVFTLKGLVSRDEYFWKLLEGLEKSFEHTQKVLIIMFRPPKKYPSRDTVPLIDSWAP